MQDFAVSRYRKHRPDVMPYLACSTGVRKLLTSSFADAPTPMELLVERDAVLGR
jgi:hypothetical protein